MIDKKIRQIRFFRAMPVFTIIGIALLVASVLPAIVSAPTESPYPVKTSLDKEGHKVDEFVFYGRPPEVEAAVVSVPEPDLAMGINTLADVPAFNWCYGCSPTAAAMLFGYYDRTAYPDMYTGPANGGVCPMDNTIWGPGIGGSNGECPLSATHDGIDGRVTPGHVDDYWVSYTSTADDPWLADGVEHTPPDCTGDFMGSNQSSFGNIDSGTWFCFDQSGAPLYDYTSLDPTERDGCHGMRLFAESRGYSVVTNYTQYIKGGPGSDPDLGFTFDDFQAEIDAGRPVLIHTEDHTVLGYGYNTTGSIVCIHNTFDYNDHEMTWGGSYLSAQHIGVTVIVLEDTLLPTVSITASDVDINDGDTDPAAFTITATFSETMDPNHTPTVVFNPQLNSTLTNRSGNWNEIYTVYTWTFDIVDAGVKVDDVDVTVDGGRDLSGDTQIPGTNTDYIDVDTQNPTVSIVASHVAINDSNIGIDALTITATFSEVMDDDYAPTLVFDPLLTSTLSNPSGTWSAGNTVYTWTFDIEDAGVNVDGVDVAVDRGRDLAGNTQIPGTNTDYIDIDTQNPTASIVTSDLYINDGDVGIDTFTITATFSETMDNSYVPIVTFALILNSTLTNPSGAWSAGDTVYNWTFDIEDVGMQVNDIGIVVDEGRDLAGNIQVPGTHTDYIDVDNQNPTVSIVSSDLSINDGDVGVDAFTITATFSEAMDNSYIPTVTFAPVLNNTLTNPSSVWSDGDTVYTWTFDIEDAEVKVDDVDVVVDGGRDLAGNLQISGSNTDYIDVDNQNPTVTITDILDYVNVLASITGTASDTLQRNIQKVEVMIKNTTDNEYWDESSWVSNETWIDATGTTSWSYDTSSINFAVGKSYLVKATTTNKAGNTSTPDSDSFTFYETPVPDFQADPISGNAPLTVQFIDESTGTISTYTWYFGDGQTTSEKNPSYTFNSPGIYTVTLTVAGPGGTGTETKSNLITIEKKGDPGGCTCFLTDAETPISELLIGWGVICLGLGVGYYIVRRARKRRK